MCSEAPVKGEPDWSAIFSVYRIESVHGGEVVSGRLQPGLDPESPPVKMVLESWPGSYEARAHHAGWDLALYRATLAHSERWWLHLLLLALTLFSTVLAGSLLAGQQAVGFIGVPLIDGWWLPLPATLDLPALLTGLPFGLTLVVILALHESGHYAAARYHHISVTPPFFIPFPPYVSIIGTLGAFIRLRSPVMNRRALLDVGIAGPAASFVASLPVLLWGLAESRTVTMPAGSPAPYLVRFMGEEIWLGGSLVFSGLARALTGFAGGEEALMLHPVAFAGWIGLFVTALNLLPISQLDGGHILYATLSERQKPLAWLFFVVLIPLGFLWAGWWVWGALVYMVGRGRVAHPPVFNDALALDGRRRALGVAAAVIFVLCFIPIPFRL